MVKVRFAGCLFEKNLLSKFFIDVAKVHLGRHLLFLPNLDNVVYATERHCTFVDSRTNVRRDNLVVSDRLHSRNQLFLAYWRRFDCLAHEVYIEAQRNSVEGMTSQ